MLNILTDDQRGYLLQCLRQPIQYAKYLFSKYVRYPKHPLSKWNCWYIKKDCRASLLKSGPQRLLSVNLLSN